MRCCRGKDRGRWMMGAIVPMCRIANPAHRAKSDLSDLVDLSDEGDGLHIRHNWNRQKECRIANPAQLVSNSAQLAGHEGVSKIGSLYRTTVTFCAERSPTFTRYTPDALTFTLFDWDMATRRPVISNTRISSSVPSTTICPLRE